MESNLDLPVSENTKLQLKLFNAVKLASSYVLRKKSTKSKCTRVVSYDIRNGSKVEQLNVNRPYVDFFRARFTADDFWSHPGDGSSKRHHCAVLKPFSTRPKIGNFHQIILSNENTTEEENHAHVNEGSWMQNCSQRAHQPPFERLSIIHDG